MATATFDKSIDVDCSKHDAYEKLSKVEVYSQFSGIAEVQARGANMAHVVANVQGQPTEFDVELNRMPDERIGWRAVSGPAMGSSLAFQPLDEQHTRLQLHVEYDAQQVSDTYHLSQQDISQRAQERLEGLKTFVEGGPG